jgi:hypothetical protein
LLRIVMALLGAGSIAGVFALCVHVLGGSVPERQAPGPLGQWTGDDYLIVEVPTTTSPFSYTSPPPASAPAGAPPSAAGSTAR